MSKAIYLLIAVPFLIFIFIFNFPAPPWPDAVFYDSVARDYLQTGMFRFAIWGDFGPTFLRANFSHMPLYPALHLVLLKFLGSTDLRALLCLNYLFAFLSILNVSSILRLRGDQRLLLALIAFSPLVYHYTNIVRPEWLNIFLLTCIWRALIVPNYIAAGIFLALSALNHHFAVFFVPCVLCVIWSREGTWSGRVRGILIVAASTAVCMAPYIYYAASNFADFKLQLLQNQLPESVSSGHWKFLKSFLVPLFFPSVGPYTYSGLIPRWQVDLPAVAVIMSIAAVALKRMRHVSASKVTIEAGVLWFFLNLGCSVTTYAVYVQFFLSVFAVSLLRDVFPSVGTAAKRGIAAFVVIGMAYQLFFYHNVSSRVFKWNDYRLAGECIAKNIPPHATVYVLANPDPSAMLSNLRSDIDIRRYIDFDKYADAWKGAVAGSGHFIISSDKTVLNRYDYGFALRNDLEKGRLAQDVCDAGNSRYVVWSRR